MIKIITIHKPGVRDHDGIFREPFEPFATTNKHYAWLTGRAARSVYDVDTLAEIIRSPHTKQGTVRRMARNGGLTADDDMDSVRSRLLVLLGELDGDAPAEAEVRADTPPPAKTSEPIEPPALDEPSEPIVPAASIKDEAWDRLRTAFLAQDFREARSALAALSDEPTPSKAVELWPVVEQLLRDRDLITDADL